MRLSYYILLLTLGITNICFAQEHLEPANGGDGLPGPITSSFIIKWASVDSASNYEYIMSDNPLCFAGCPGDTRQRSTGDTTATEYNLQEGKWYYWITRIYYLNGDTSYWTNISSFLAKTPPQLEPDEIVKVSPNPGLNKIVVLKIDWATIPGAREITVVIQSLLGFQIAEVVVEKSGIRYQDYSLNLPSNARGTYIASFTVGDNPNNPNNRFTKKIIVL
jgi:hypothetical protein